MICECERQTLRNIKTCSCANIWLIIAGKDHLRASWKHASLLLFAFTDVMSIMNTSTSEVCDKRSGICWYEYWRRNRDKMLIWWLSHQSPFKYLSILMCCAHEEMELGLVTFICRGRGLRTIDVLLREIKIKEANENGVIKRTEKQTISMPQHWDQSLNCDTESGLVQGSDSNWNMRADPGKCFFSMCDVMGMVSLNGGYLNGVWHVFIYC